MKKGYVYIVTNKSRSTNYIGVTNDLDRRMFEHKSGKGSVFTAKYKLHYLMYYEVFHSFQQAIDREKQLKGWKKEWKWNLIKEENPRLTDLAKDWFEEDFNTT